MRRADPRFAENFVQLGREYMRYLALRRDLMATLVTDPALTVDYTYAEPPLQPRLHTVRVAWAYSPLASPGVPNPGTFTVNAGLDYYQDAQPTGVGNRPLHSRSLAGGGGSMIIAAAQFAASFSTSADEPEHLHRAAGHSAIRARRFDPGGA
jgi:hypothetical protein